MLNIEIKKVPGTEPDTYKQFVCINGIDDVRGHYITWAVDGETYRERSWHIRSNKAWVEIGAFSFNEVADHFSRIEVTLNHPRKNESELALDIEVAFAALFDEERSVRQQADALKKEVEKLNDVNVVYYQDDDTGVTNGWGLYYYPPELERNSPLKQVTNTAYNLFEELNEQAITILSETHSGSLITKFEFPKEIESTCHQYLIYFSQFLSDFGIEADAEIKMNLNQTLFSVIPKR